MCAKEANIAPVGFKIPFDNIRRAKVTLPYLPDLINYTGCCAIKKNGGLYTPCCGKTLAESTYCKTCSVDKEGEFKELEFGDIEDRDSNVEEEVFAPISFGEWMKGHKTTLPEVYEKLRAAGVPIEIPARELSVRELPKRRKGRPTRSEDSVEDEDSPKAKKAAKASGSESDAPKAKKASKEKASKAAASDDEAPKKAKKASKAKASKADASESETEKPKAKKASKAESETEKPKAKKASKAADEAPKAKKASKAADEAPKAKKADSGSEDSDAKAARKAAKKAAKAAAEEAEAAEAEAEAEAAKKAKKAKKAAEAAAKEAAAKEAAHEGELEVEEEEEEIDGDYEQDCEIEGKDYNLRNGKIICDKESGEILGSLDENGDPAWNSEKR